LGVKWKFFPKKVIQKFDPRIVSVPPNSVPETCKNVEVTVNYVHRIGYTEALE